MKKGTRTICEHPKKLPVLPCDIFQSMPWKKGDFILPNSGNKLQSKNSTFLEDSVAFNQ